MTHATDTAADRPSPRRIETDICVIGAGAAGLSVASTAALLGAPVVLIEKGTMGGDCLNTGCVPSKALIAAGHAADAIHRAGRFGVKSTAPVVDQGELVQHIRSVIGGIAPVDSPERYRALGVNVIQAEARFIDARTVEAGDAVIRARRFVLATGAAPVLPPIPGLDTVSCLTSETIFTLAEAPRRLVIIGGGPIGVELAQAHRRLSCDVTLIEAERILRNEDAEAVEVARRALLRDGVKILEGAKVTRVQALKSGVTMDIVRDGVEEMLNASHILVAVGRRPRTGGLGLEAAGVEYGPKGITTDQGLRTSNKRVYAIGDCIDGPQFTHAAGYQAGLVIRNALFRQSVRADYTALPRVTYADPEIASVGLSEEAARASRRGVVTLRFPFAENDRARTELRTEGLVKVMVDRKGVVLGAVVAGPHAGELISLWTLAVSQRLKIDAIADLVFPYPTFSEASKRAALQAYAARLRNPWLPRILKFVRMLG